MIEAEVLATARYGLALAPDGLFAAQELLNSGLPSDVARDPLRSLETAAPWFDATLSEWARRARQEPSALTIADRDLPRLRRARTALRAWLTGQDPSAASAAPVVIGLAAGREVSYAAGSGGAAGLESIVAVELLLASRLDRARRLKVCANPACGAALYDGSPNGSRRWHDVRTCGNVANLRASRARKAGAAVAPDEDALAVDPR